MPDESIEGSLAEERLLPLSPAPAYVTPATEGNGQHVYCTFNLSELRDDAPSAAFEQGNMRVSRELVRFLDRTLENMEFVGHIDHLPWF